MVRFKKSSITDNANVVAIRFPKQLLDELIVRKKTMGFGSMNQTVIQLVKRGIVLSDLQMKQKKYYFFDADEIDAEKI